MTVYIYNYDNDTKEYLGFQEADKDPEMSRIKGDFVPLIPANAVLTAPPDFGENEIPVYEAGKWVIKADYRRNFYKSDYYLNISEIDTIGEQEGFILIDKETGEDVKAHPNNYKIVNNEIVKKSEEEIAAEALERAKREKIFENDTAREASLNSGVMYKGILFDSDTEQKTNIIGTVLTMSETDTIMWYGMNSENAYERNEMSSVSGSQNGGSDSEAVTGRRSKHFQDSLECTKEDLENIGALIAQLHSFCWTRNAEIKHEIALAETIDEVNAVIIDYEVPHDTDI